VSSKLISDLTNDELEAYTYLSQRAKALYSTDAYSAFYNRIQKEFDGVTSFRIGTVGAYVKGYQLETNLTPHGCSIQAVGALPSPGEDVCSHPVYLAEVKNGAYKFNALHTPGKRSGGTPAYVFVPKGFQGFTRPEREWLTNNVGTFTLFEVNDDGTEYTIVLTEPPRRVRALPDPGCEKAIEPVERSYVYTISAVVICILIAIIVLRNYNIRFFQ
jgi:hypothetical protein